MTTAGLPAGLRDRVLAAAHAARPPGRSLPAAAEITPVEALRRAVDALDELLLTLDAQHGGVPALRGLDVNGLVGHLTGVELDTARALAGDPAVACVDHVRSTQAAAVAAAGQGFEETRRAWRDAADATLSRVAADDPARVVAVHGMRLPLGALLVVRAFELWTHENDIRAALGLAPSAPDPSTLPMLTDLAARMLPHGVARVDAGHEPVDVHLVLTGAGGGTWDVALGERPAGGDVPEVTIVADALTFCRLVANRVRPADLPAHLSGAVAHAPWVLAGAAALALD
ncbi:maleylpyruvate isomerase family mycothiol-dependent enzyme [Pseudonocardia sp. CA-107938]|uniref:maleylpyruvate isomerase family mycothiol-dependent enzyme n=1 Tax=Pseudonocardia sp. CA-107938 TaxID=3240021 RepID=UPI003D8A42CD